MIRLCFVTDYALSMGGKERQLLELCTALSELDLWVMILSISANGILPAQLKQRNLRCVVLKREEESIWHLNKHIIGLIREHDITHLYSFDTLSHCLVILPSLLCNTKLINGSIRDAGTERALGYIYVLISLFFSKYVVANSHSGLDYYRIRRKCAVLYNAINLKRFTKCNMDCTRIVMVANFTAYKDQKCLIRAASLLTEKGYNIRVTFIGDGATLPECKTLAKQSCEKNIFEFMGFADKVENELEKHGIGVLCSTKKYKEGISNSILEYMGSGLIAVASDVGATQEIIEDKSNGFLFSTEDSQSLVNSLMYVIDNWSAMHKIRENAKVTLATKFNSKANARRLIEILNGI